MTTTNNNNLIPGKLYKTNGTVISFIEKSQHIKNFKKIGTSENDNMYLINENIILMFVKMEKCKYFDVKTESYTFICGSSYIKIYKSNIEFLTQI